MFNWFRKGTLKIPSSTHSSKNGVSIYTQNFSPLRNIHSLSFECDIAVAASIIGLLFVCCPFYIAGFIVPVIVYSLDRVLHGWFWSDVIKESHEISFPFFANSYATAPVIFKRCIVRVVTAAEHQPPCVVFVRVRHAMRNIKVFFETTATPGVARSECGASDNSCVTANTSTEPLGLFMFIIFKAFDNGKSSKSLAGKINELRHNKASLVKGAGCGWMLAGGQPGSRFSGMTLASS